MTHFVHIDYPATHAGLNRVMALAQGAKQLTQSPRLAVALRLGAVVGVALASIWAVAHQMASASSEGALLAGTVVLWLAALGAFAWSAAPSTGAAFGLKAHWQAWRAERLAAQRDSAMWQAAQADYRVMQELRSAMDRLS